MTRTPKTVPACNLEVRFCVHCGVCSLLNTDVDKLAYDDDYTSSSIAYGSIKSVDEQTDRFADFIGKSDKPQGSQVLEIGCYDGVLMTLLKQRYRFNVSGCEPCVAAAEEAAKAGHIVHFDAFEASRYRGLAMIVARNVLEHIASPNQFVKNVASSLAWSGAFVLEVPAGEHYIRNGILGTIVPQHPCYFGKDSLERLLGNHFTIVSVEEDKATIRARASYPRQDKGEHNRKRDTVRATWLGTGEQVRRTRYTTVRKAVGNEKVAVFGANTCAMELISTGTVRVEQIDKAYDDDHHKWGRYLVNTSIAVLPRSALSGEGRRKVLVCSYTHRQPIANYITEQNSIAVKLYGDDE